MPPMADDLRTAYRGYSAPRVSWPFRLRLAYSLATQSLLVTSDNAARQKVDPTRAAEGKQYSTRPLSQGSKFAPGRALGSPAWLDTLASDGLYRAIQGLRVGYAVHKVAHNTDITAVKMGNLALIEQPDHPHGVDMTAVINDQQCVTLPKWGKYVDRRVKLDHHLIRTFFPA